ACDRVSCSDDEAGFFFGGDLGHGPCGDGPCPSAAERITHIVVSVLQEAAESRTDCYNEANRVRIHCCAILSSRSSQVPDEVVRQARREVGDSKVLAVEPQLESSKGTSVGSARVLAFLVGNESTSFCSPVDAG